MTQPQLTHITPEGEINMVNIATKPDTLRQAKATAKIHLHPDTLTLIQTQQITKGNVLATARIAGIQAAKQTPNLIPLCHQLLLNQIEITFAINTDHIEIHTLIQTTGKTGAEIEALTAASIAAITIYDMCKAVDKTMQITDLKLTSKTKTPLQQT